MGIFSDGGPGPDRFWQDTLLAMWGEVDSGEGQAGRPIRAAAEGLWEVTVTRAGGQQ